MKYYLLLPLIAFSALSAGESWYDKEDIALGKSLFDKNCVVCHGANATGTVVDWRKKMSNGKLPPPPLNGTAHTWHHKPALLDKIIQEGGETYGDSYKGWMPAFKDKLDAKERLAVLKYIHSLWPKKIQEGYDEFNKIK